jgi:F0F1-type ATP synthase assembly protein I
MDKPSDPTQKDSQKNTPEQANAALKWSGLAFQMMAMIGLGVWGGMWLDKKLALTFPAFTLGLSLLGVVGSLVMVFREATKES